jgi:mycothiol system anti-sigma-R factor
MTKQDRIRCEEVIEHLFAYLDGELDPAKRAHIDAHLEECRGCCSRADFERALKRKLAQSGEHDPPETLKRRIRRLIDAF